MNNNGFIKICKDFIIKIDKEYPIKLAYLFGSRAKGTENAMSDVDIALIFNNTYDAMDEIFIRGYIIEKGKSYFNLEVDVVQLNKASLALKYEVIKDGIIIKDTDDGTRAEFESLALREYFDFRYYADIYNESMIRDIKDRTYFGG